MSKGDKRKILEELLKSMTTTEEKEAFEPGLLDILEKCVDDQKLETMSGGLFDFKKRSMSGVLAGLTALGPMAVDSAAQASSKRSFYINKSDSEALAVMGVTLFLGVVLGGAGTYMVVNRFKNAEPVTLSPEDISCFSNVECLNTDIVNETESETGKKALLELANKFVTRYKINLGTGDIHTLFADFTLKLSAGNFENVYNYVNSKLKKFTKKDINKNAFLGCYMTYVAAYTEKFNSIALNRKEDEMETLRKENQMIQENTEQIKKLKESYQEKLDRQASEYQAETNKLKNDYETQIEEIKQQHSNEKRQTEKEHQTEKENILKQLDDYKKQLTLLKVEHKQNLDRIEQNYEHGSKLRDIRKHDAESKNLYRENLLALVKTSLRLIQLNQEYFAALKDAIDQKYSHLLPPKTTGKKLQELVETIGTACQSSIPDLTTEPPMEGQQTIATIEGLRSYIKDCGEYLILPVDEYNCALEYGATKDEQAEILSRLLQVQLASTKEFLSILSAVIEEEYSSDSKTPNCAVRIANKTIERVLILIENTELTETMKTSLIKMLVTVIMGAVPTKILSDVYDYVTSNDQNRLSDLEIECKAKEFVDRYYDEIQKSKNSNRRRRHSVI